MESKLAIYFVTLLAVCGSAFASSCQNPEVTATSFTSKDVTIVTHVAYITEFTLKCDSAVPKSYALYAEVDNTPLTAARIGEGKYQISWTEEAASAKTGVREVRLYDEDSWTALRRARREDTTASAPATLTIQLYHPGSYSGPWVNSEILAAVLSIAVAYTAIKNKSKILS